VSDHKHSYTGVPHWGFLAYFTQTAALAFISANLLSDLRQKHSHH